MLCTSEKTALRATTLFACLYMLSGAFITCVGIYTIQYLPELFTTGSVIWTGIIIFGLGGTALLMACCGAVSYRKGLVLLIIAALVLVLCILNIVLLETIEWKYGIIPMPNPDPDKEIRRDYLFFLMCVLSLFGTVIGLLTSLFNLVYAYCIILVPLQQSKKRREIMKERVKLHQSLKIRSPRGTPDGNTNSKPPTIESVSPEQPRNNSNMPDQHHDWVYNNEISSELSVSSGGIEMVANKAFLQETLSCLETPIATPQDSPVLGNRSQDHPENISTGHCEIQENVEVVDSGYQWKQRAQSSFLRDAADKDPWQSKSKMGHSIERRRSNFHLTIQDEEKADLADVNTVFNKLENVLNSSISPGNQASCYKLEESVDRNGHDAHQLEQYKRRNSRNDDVFVTELSNTRL